LRDGVRRLAGDLVASRRAIERWRWVFPFGRLPGEEIDDGCAGCRREAERPTIGGGLAGVPRRHQGIHYYIQTHAFYTRWEMRMVWCTDTVIDVYNQCDALLYTYTYTIVPHRSYLKDAPVPKPPIKHANEHPPMLWVSLAHAAKQSNLSKPSHTHKYNKKSKSPP